ncbi:hypothetical protein [Salininema proteolyticum]|uniref:Uncharacterized protein n=1 Tax=Salininema proteolyticum TaxID=1607685 RepID=A0ABV8TTL6_9ACTN
MRLFAARVDYSPRTEVPETRIEGSLRFSATPRDRIEHSFIRVSESTCHIFVYSLSADPERAAESGIQLIHRALAAASDKQDWTVVWAKVLL